MPIQELLEPRSAGFSVSGEVPNVAVLGSTDCLIGTSVSAAKATYRYRHSMAGCERIPDIRMTLPGH